ncbi:universal stress protein [Actinoplanes sp. NPDC049681]|uniref:universal stress protein n=1 Tax=Actinoplanes sp. NPDC049681 TaxID=3363905 RepID=UPI0037A0D6AD
MVSAALQQARAASPGISLEADSLIGDAASHLIELSGTVGLVVVGSRARGRRTGLQRDAVGRRVALHAAGPVVVVRGRTDARGGPVAAGVDSSPRGETVLQQAYETADALGCGLRVVHSYSSAMLPWAGTAPPTLGEIGLLEEAERERLYALLAPWQDEYPQVDSTLGLSHRNAASALTAASQLARLLIVGRHGHGAIASALLGSTTLSLLRHADCPVLVVHTRVVGCWDSGPTALPGVRLQGDVWPCRRRCLKRSGGGDCCRRCHEPLSAAGRGTP